MRLDEPQTKGKRRSGGDRRLAPARRSIRVKCQYDTAPEQPTAKGIRSAIRLPSAGRGQEYARQEPGAEGHRDRGIRVIPNLPPSSTAELLRFVGGVIDEVLQLIQGFGELRVNLRFEDHDNSLFADLECEGEPGAGCV